MMPFANITQTLMCEARKSTNKHARRFRQHAENQTAEWHSGIRLRTRRAARRQHRELRCKSYARSQPTSRNWSNPPAISPPYRPRELQIRCSRENDGTMNSSSSSLVLAGWLAGCWVHWMIPSDLGRGRGIKKKSRGCRDNSLVPMEKTTCPWNSMQSAKGVS